MFGHNTFKVSQLKSIVKKLLEMPSFLLIHLTTRFCTLLITLSKITAFALISSIFWLN